jgi:hypothetical protein
MPKPVCPADGAWRRLDERQSRYERINNQRPQGEIDCRHPQGQASDDDSLQS